MDSISKFRKHSDNIDRYIIQARSVCDSISCQDQDADPYLEHLSDLAWLINDRLKDIKTESDAVFAELLCRLRSDSGETN